MVKIPLAKIKLGRCPRKDLGDIEALAASILATRLLHPILVRPDYTLVCGRRRIEAYKKLGRAAIEANIADDLQTAEEYLRAQQDENTCRKDLTPSEAVAVGTEIEKLFAPKAKAAHDEGTSKGGKVAGKGRPKKTDSSGASCPKAKRDESARTTFVAAAGVGMSRKSYEKAKAVVASKNVEAIQEMDRTGKVDRAYKMVAGGEDSGNNKSAKRSVRISILKKLDQGLAEVETEVGRDRILISPAHIKRKVTELRTLVARLISGRPKEEM